jgi:hypothetical protein
MLAAFSQAEVSSRRSSYEDLVSVRLSVTSRFEHTLPGGEGVGRMKPNPC